MSKNRPRPIAIVARRCQEVIGRRFMRAATVGLGDAGIGAGAGVGMTGSLRPAVMAVPPRIDLMWSEADRLCQQRYFPQFGQPVVLKSGAHSPLPCPLSPCLSRFRARDARR